MKSRVLLIILLLAVAGCSDLSTGPEADWLTYDLPYGHISMPPELALARGGGGFPLNPEYEGVVDNKTLDVQFCIYEVTWESGYWGYQEQEMMLNGCRAVLFKCVGVFHLYDSHFSKIVGMRAYFRPGAEPVTVLIEIDNPDAEGIALAILRTMRP